MPPSGEDNERDETEFRDQIREIKNDIKDIYYDISSLETRVEKLTEEQAEIQHQFQMLDQGTGEVQDQRTEKERKEATAHQEQEDESTGRFSLDLGGLPEIKMPMNGIGTIFLILISLIIILCIVAIYRMPTLTEELVRYYLL